MERTLTQQIKDVAINYSIFNHGVSPSGALLILFYLKGIITKEELEELINFN